MITWRRSFIVLKMNKVYSLLGLAAKSRNLVSGEFMTEKVIKDGKAVLVIVSDDSSDNTKKMFSNMCIHYEVPLETYGTKANLGHAIGKEQRASLAITDKGFAETVKKQLAEAKKDTEVE